MPPRPSLPEIFLVALRLGCTSFGGPVAHLAYFRAEFVVKRRWLGEAHYADLVARTRAARKAVLFLLNLIFFFINYSAVLVAALPTLRRITSPT